MKHLGFFIFMLLACLSIAACKANQKASSYTEPNTANQDLSQIPEMEDIPKWQEFIQIQTSQKPTSGERVVELLGEPTKKEEVSDSQMLTWELDKHITISITLKDQYVQEKNITFVHTRGTCMLFPGIPDGTSIKEAFEKTGRPYMISDKEGKVSCSWYMAGKFHYLKLQEQKVYRIDEP